jgi:triacylglycerol lipase
MLRKTWTRRSLLSAVPGLALATAGCQIMTPIDPFPPIVFVHGNGDTAALWMTTLWRFESNGWPRERLHAIHLPYPLARDLDEVAQPGRTSTAEHRDFLAAEVARVLAATRSARLVLVGNSRGGNAIRSYVAKGGADKVSHAILGGTPNHGVRIDAKLNPGNEFNGAGPFLTALNNQGALGVEVTPGPKWLSIRSDNNDKFAQPDGLWLGAPGKATGVTFDGPALNGATNLVLAGVDHRETSFSDKAFAATFEFITGRAPATTGFTPEAQVVLGGQVSGQGLANNPAMGGFANNLALVGAVLEVFALDNTTAVRLGQPVLSQVVGADGRWGPLAVDAATRYEFVITAPGYAVTHMYREPFVRSSTIVNLRATTLSPADAQAGAVVFFNRPRGYFGLPRDRVTLDGIDPAPGIPQGVAGVAVSKRVLPASPLRTVVGQFNSQTVVGRSWPAAQNHVVFLELH